MDKRVNLFINLLQVQPLQTNKRIQNNKTKINNNKIVEDNFELL